MNFINNYAQQVQLAAGAQALALELPNGTYRLTLSDARGQAATKWEHVDALVTGGAAQLVRGLEGSIAQDWPAGSWIYCSLTAGVVGQLFAQLDAQSALIVTQQTSLSGLAARVTALENADIPANGLRVTLGVDAAGDSFRAGYFEPGGEGSGLIGSVSPAAVEVAGVGTLAVASIQAMFDEFSPPQEFSLSFVGDVRSLLAGISTVDVQGVGTLALAGAYELYSDPFSQTVRTDARWVDVTSDWASGGSRLITFNPA